MPALLCVVIRIKHRGRRSVGCQMGGRNNVQCGLRGGGHCWCSGDGHGHHSWSWGHCCHVKDHNKEEGTFRLKEEDIVVSCFYVLCAFQSNIYP